MAGGTKPKGLINKRWRWSSQSIALPLSTVQISTVLVEIANVYFMQGDYRNARSQLEEGLQLAQQHQQLAIVAVALHRLGSVYYAQGQYADALRYGEQALSRYQAIGDKAGMANALNNLGNIARITGNYAIAQTHREASLRQEIGDLWGIAASLNNLAVIPYLQGNYQQAQQYWEESLRLRQDLGDRWAAAQTLDNLGLVAFSQGDSALACQRHTESLALRRAVGDKPGSAISLSNADFVVDEQRYGVYGRDWHTLSPMAWLAAIAERELGNGMPNPTLPTSAPLSTLNEAEFAAAVREALHDFINPNALQNNALLRTQLIVQRAGPDSNGAIRAGVLKKLLQEAAAPLQAAPGQASFFRVLQHTYFQPAATQEQAAELLDLPFSTYRRHLRSGIEYVTESLWQRAQGNRED